MNNVFLKNLINTNGLRRTIIDFFGPNNENDQDMFVPTTRLMLIKQRSSMDNAIRQAAKRLLAVLICVLSISVSVASTGPTIETEAGTLEGVRKGDVEQFLGVPFAAPPVGKLRWSKPQAVKQWVGVRSATAYASKCVQNGWVKPIQHYRDEDCLYLNIYRPALPAAQPLPILVWLHGGASVAGSSQDIDGSVFAAKTGHIVISVNYRLGAFGLASFEKSGSNFWLKDQQAALQWIKANANAFGGNPNHVTLIGQSAGAYSITAHMISPASAGLFHRAIAMSLPVGPLYAAIPAEQERQSGPTARMVKKAGCAAAADVLSCMRGKSTEEVFQAGGGDATRAAGWQMVIDKESIPDNQMKLFTRGEFYKVPTLVGFTHEEQGFFLQARRASGQPPLSAEAFENAVSSTPKSAKVAAIYKVSAYSSPTIASIAMVSDKWGCEVDQWVKTVSRFMPVFFYEFDDPDAPTTIFQVDEPKNGPFHNSDIPYIFQRGYPNEQNSDAPAWQPAQLALSDRIMGYFAQFSKTGIPSKDWSQSLPMILHPDGDKVETGAAFAKRHFCEAWYR